MARRRLNTKVFAILLAVIVLAGGGLMAAQKFGRNRGDPKALEAEGDALMEKRDYEQAQLRYAAAADRDPSNPGLRVKLGESLVKLTKDDPMNLARAHRAWNEALTVEPGYKPALERLLKSLWEQVDLSGGAARAEVFGDIRQRAEQLAKADPAHPQAKVWRHVATVRQWLAGQAVGAEEIEASTQALAELAAQNPADAEPPFYVALARLKTVDDRLKARAPVEAERAAAAAADGMTKALAGQDRNAQMQYRAAQVFRQLARLDPRAAARAGHAKRADACFARAAEVVEKTNPDIAGIVLNAADARMVYDGWVRAVAAAVAAAADAVDATTALRPAVNALAAADTQLAARRRDEAGAMVKKFYEESPNNQQARLAWARWLTGQGPAERAQAIEVLSQEVPLPPDAVGVGVIVHKEQQAKTLYELVRLRLADAAATDAEAAKGLGDPPDPAKLAAANAAAAARQKQAAVAVDTDMAKLRKLASPKAPLVLALEGQVLLFKNQPVEAVKAMEEAYAGMPAGDKDWDLVLRLAQTYATKTMQPGLARKLTEELVSVATVPQGLVLPARVLLAQLLVQENRLAAAHEQMREISRVAPGHPDLDRLNRVLVVADRQQQFRQLQQSLSQLQKLEQQDPRGTATSKAREAYKAEVQKAELGYTAFPERTNPERYFKAEIARVTERQDEQVRLLNDVVRADPKDIGAIRALAGLYQQRKLPDRARQVVEAGTLANPKDKLLPLLLAELNGATPEQLREQVKAGIMAEADADPYAQAMRLFDLERVKGGSPEAALRHLVKAAELKPDDARARDALFAYYLGRLPAREADARAQLAKLVELNADQVGGRLYRHRFAVARRDFVEAERVGLDLVTSYPEFAQSWLALGQAQDALGKWNEAVRSYTEVLVRQPKQYDAARALVDALYNAGRTDEAEVRLRDMRALFPNDPVGRELYLNHLANFGKPQLAIPDREDMLKKSPDDSWPYLALAATYFKDAQRLGAENKLDESEAQIKKALNVLNRGLDKFPDETRFHAQVAEVHQYNGKLEQAEAGLKAYADRELTKAAPAVVRPDPWLALSDLYARSNRMGDAADAMSLALGRATGTDVENPLSEPNLRLRLAAVQVQARRFADAQATLDGAKNRDDPRVARQRIELLIARQSFPEAEAAIKAVLATRDGADLRNLMASVLIDTNRGGEAMPHLQKALALDPTNERPGTCGPWPT
jgi:predicted Zn-dependent protease